MKVHITEDEWYPVYNIYPVEEEEKGVETLFHIEIPDELFQEYKKVLSEFNTIQDKIDFLLKKKREKNK